MSRVLAYTSPARGHLFPLTPVLDELRGRGHSVAVRTLADGVETMRERGLDAAPIDPAIEGIPLGDQGARSPLAAQKRALQAFGRRAGHEIPDLDGAITAESPDVLLVDVNCWGAQAAAARSGLPWAVWSPYPLWLPSKDLPPFGPGLRPARGPAGRLRDRVLGPLMSGALARVIRPEADAVRAQAGLPPLGSVGELLTAPPLLLLMTAEPFEYPRSDWPANVRLVGPCDWDPPASPPDWLDEVTDPIVLVTTSSEAQDDGRLVETALSALAGSAVHVVATMPSGVPPSLRVPPNARVLPFVPHGPVLDRAVCAVTHGGMGATQKALARGVPVVAVPFGRDQLEVARRVEVAGAGVRLPARSLGATRLRAAVAAARACAPGARRVAEAFAAAPGPAGAAAAVEGLVPSARVPAAD